MTDGSAVPGGVKFVALLLAVGGVAGALIGLWTQTEILSKTGMRPSINTALMGAVVLVFGFCAWIGVQLWKGKPAAYRWAKILFAAQIPVITVPGFEYEFHTGLTVRILVGTPGVNFNFHLGSTVAFYISSAVHIFVIGVNLVALGVLIYLLRETSRGQGQPEADSLS